jgi:outer membrane lipoprotein-sorting protein
MLRQYLYKGVLLLSPGKRIWAALLVGVIALGFAATASAAPGIPVAVFIDGVMLTEPAYIISGRTLVPFRAIFTALGAEVDWDADTSTAIGVKDGVEVRLTANSKIALVGGRQVEIAVPPQFISGRTFVPLRFVAEALGAEVNYESAANRVTVASAAAGPVAPPVNPPVAPPQGNNSLANLKALAAEHSSPLYYETTQAYSSPLYGDHTTSQKAWFQDDKKRAETTDIESGDPKVAIYDGEKYYVYFPTHNQATIEPIPRSEALFSIATHVAQIPADASVPGRETVGGVDCLITEYYSGAITYKFWLGPNGLPAKLEMTYVDGGHSVIEFRNYQFGSCSDGLFRLPSGVEIIDNTWGSEGN